MRPRRPWAVVAVLALLAGAGAWWLGRARSPEAPTAGEGHAPDGAESVAPPRESLLGAPGAHSKGSAHGTCRLSGTVTRDGSPATARVDVQEVGPVGARVALDVVDLLRRALVAPLARPTPTGSVEAPADGRFEFTSLVPGSYRVVALAPDGSAAAAAVSLSFDGESRRVDLPLGSEVLAGRTVHADGSAWRGTVIVRSNTRTFDDPSRVEVVTSTDDAGRFRAVGLPRGSVWVAALDVGAFRATSPPTPVPYPGGEFVFVVDEGLSPLEGRVVSASDGGPVAAAELGEYDVPGEGLIHTAVAATDAQGRFVVPAPTHGDATLHVRAAGFVPLSVEIAERPRPIEIRLTPAARLVGRVATADGTPAAGARIALYRRDGEWSAERVGTEALAGGDGRYEATDLPACEVKAVVEGGGWITDGPRELDATRYDPAVVVLTAGKVTTLDLVVLRAARIVGRVLDTDGSPLPSVQVSAVRSRSPGSGDLGEAPVPPAQGARDGGFVVDGLVPGATYVLTAQAEGRVPATSDPVIAGDGTGSAVELRFPPARFVDVTILDEATSQAVSGATAGLAGTSPDFRDRNPGEQRPRSGADGVLHAGPYPAGPLRIWIAHPEYLRSEIVDVASEASGITVRLSRGLVLAGHVVDAQGLPKGRMVVVLPELHDSVPVQFSDATGAFRFAAVPPGRHLVRASWDAWGATVTAEAGDQDVRLVVASPGGGRPTPLEVRVLGPDGKPVVGALIQSMTEHQSQTSEVEEGHAELNALSIVVGTEQRSVRVWGARDEAGVRLPFGSALVERIRVDRAELEIRLPPGRVLTGTVRGPDGRPVEGVVLAAHPPKVSGAAFEWDGADGTARTDAAGSFRLDSLGAGEYTIEVSPPPAFAATAPVALAAGQSTLDVRLTLGVSVTVTVRGHDEKPIGDAQVEAGIETDGGTNRSCARTTTDAQGRAVLDRLEAGTTYVLEVRPPRGSGGRRLKDVRLDAWRPADTTVRLDELRVVHGIVFDLQGNPAPDVSVGWVAESGEGWGGKTDEGGRFMLNDVPMGVVRVRASSCEFASHVPAGDRRIVEVPLPKDGAEVRLDVDLGAVILARIEDPTPAPTTIEWSLIERRADGAPAVRSHTTHTVLGSSMRWIGLDDASAAYDVLARSDARGLVAYARDVRPGAGVALRMVPGKSVTGAIRVPAGAQDVTVQARVAGSMVEGVVTPDGRYRISGLPDGLTVAVWALASVGDDLRESPEQEVRAGGVADLEVPDK